MGVFVVVPTYNEAQNIEALVTAVSELQIRATLVFVDDNSPDGTGRIAASLAESSPNVQVIQRDGKLGLGPAYVAGFDHALAQGAAVVVHMDADGSHDPRAIPSLVHPIATGEADVAFGSRYVDGGIVYGWPLQRRVLSRVANQYARIVLGDTIRDYTSGFAAFSRLAMEMIPYRRLASVGFAYLVELKAACERLGLNIAQVPITFRDRRRGDSKLSVCIAWEALFVILQARSKLQSLPEGGMARAREGQRSRMSRESRAN